MREIDRLLLNIKTAHKDIIAISKKNDLTQEEKQAALYTFQKQIKEYEVELLVALSRENAQPANG